MSSLPETPYLNRDYARLLLVMRKLVRNEFEVILPLDRAETPILLVHYARRSRDTMLHEMANELEEMLAGPQVPEARETDVGQREVVRYRGAVVAAQPQPEHPATEEAVWYRGVPQVENAAVLPPPGARRVKRVYRGQVIEE